MGIIYSGTQTPCGTPKIVKNNMQKNGDDLSLTLEIFSDNQLSKQCTKSN